MTNDPLSSTNLSKILIFTLLMLPIIGFGVGIIPAIFIVFGLVMMKRSQNFSHIETATRNFKTYTKLVLVGCILFTLYFATTLGAEDSWDRDEEEFFISLALSAVSLLYIFLVDKLFYIPLLEHKDWVSQQGIFSNAIPIVSAKHESEINIIKGEKMKSFSVADELLKWAKLKEDGHITEQEFNEAREKLLQRT